MLNFTYSHILVQYTFLICLYISEHKRPNLVACDGFLRHKTFLASPKWLIDQGVTVYTALQQPGDYVIVKPGVIHWGMNLGFNTAEAVNYALEDHVEETVDTDGYKFTVCHSGCVQSSGDHDICEIGAETEVAEIYHSDMEELSAYPTPAPIVQKRVACKTKGGKPSRAKRLTDRRKPKKNPL